MGPRLKSSRRHTSELKHRWPRPPSSLGEVCVFFLFVGFVCVCSRFVSVSSLVFCPVWSYLFATERYYRCMSGTTADKRQAVLPPTPAVLPAGQAMGGVMSGQGELFLPHTHSPPLACLPRRSSDLSPQEGPGRPLFSCCPSPFPPVESIPTTSSCHGCRYCPRSHSLFA